MANLAILTTPKAVLPTFTLSADRHYWAQPRTVRVLYSDREGLVWVTDPHVAFPFPTNGAWLRWEGTQRLAGPFSRITLDERNGVPILLLTTEPKPTPDHAPPDVYGQVQDSWS